MFQSSIPIISFKERITSTATKKKLLKSVVPILLVCYLLFVLNSHSNVIFKSDLPNATQKWAHSTVTKSKLQNALEDPDVTSIEADLLMGNVYKDSNSEKGLPLVPIMAHPPDKVSDLSMEKFIDLSLLPKKHHIKLDFKEFETVSKTIQYINQATKGTSFSDDDPTVFLNADILPGPGKRNDPLTIEADEFIETCLQNIESKNNNGVKYAFSLGWATDPRAYSGYTNEDVDKMKEVIEHYKLLSRSKGVVLAVNARNLYKRLDVFDDFLKDNSSIQVLAWTATGEPPISNYQVDKIHTHFKELGIEKQLGFDCQTSGFITGFIYECAVVFASILWNMQKLFV